MDAEIHNIETRGEQTPEDIANEDEIPDEERGCGHLKPDSAYLQSGGTHTPAAGKSGDGVLPAFVRLDPPIKYKGDHLRSWKAFNSVQYEMALPDDVETEPVYPADMTWEDVYDEYDLPDDMHAENEVERHLRRVIERGHGADTADSSPAFKSNDLIMSVGKTHYPDAEDYIEETVKQGVSKKVNQNSIPEVYEGITRLWLIHPEAVEATDDDGEPLLDDDGEPVYYEGIIGYVYLTQPVYTRDEEGDVPDSISEMEDAGKVNVVEIGEKIPVDDPRHPRYEEPDEDEAEQDTDEDDEDEPDEESEPEEAEDGEDTDEDDEWEWGEEQREQVKEAVGDGEDTDDEAEQEADEEDLSLGEVWQKVRDENEDEIKAWRTPGGGETTDELTTRLTNAVCAEMDDEITATTARGYISDALDEMDRQTLISVARDVVEANDTARDLYLSGDEEKQSNALNTLRKSLLSRVDYDIPSPEAEETIEEALSEYDIRDDSDDEEDEETEDVSVEDAVHEVCEEHREAADKFTNGSEAVQTAGKMKLHHEVEKEYPEMSDDEIVEAIQEIAPEYAADDSEDDEEDPLRLAVLAAAEDNPDAVDNYLSDSDELQEAGEMVLEVAVEQQAPDDYDDGEITEAISEIIPDEYPQAEA